ncbi:MAG TPA: alpha-amylase/4-alpha-glucanotransferase domain-containing protein [Candidatus Krumholzibacteria bacterium]|nr:alpha-amylase/4-alpha-glucanotransferase domain-containing protein [Candidatus Krumholzibacteria bacterium]
MSRTAFVFALHNHQPVGNFDHVFEHAHTQAYAPMLAVLARHPQMRACLHQSGVLWEWMEAHHPEYLEQVRVLVRRGQLELLSGGFYEPILVAIPEADRQEQIARLQRFLESRFGVVPRGAWLAERVWEPQLAETLARAGLQYTVVDDTHFQSAGWPASSLLGSFLTEDNGNLLRVFPIAKRLRYLLPFAEPEEAVEYLRQQAQAGEGVLMVHADDGEKFGIWPGTHARCYEQGWLERFFTAVEAQSDWLQTTTFADSLTTHPARGRIYLPTASYSEMMEWALPVPAQAQLHAARELLAAQEGGAALQDFVRGGFWRNFLARYPEGNWLHKKMMHLSRRLSLARARGESRNGEVQQAAEHLLRSQSNDAYWHGLFGGLYLPHLRSALYHEIVRAEALLDGDGGHATEVLDYDVDGRPEIVLRTTRALAVLKPDSGGAVFELDDRQRGFNVLDLLARRPEAYHERLRRGSEKAAADASGTVSIHDLVVAKEPELEKALLYDAYRKGSFIDHLLPASATSESWEKAALPELASPWAEAYDWRLEGDSVRLECTVPLRAPASGKLVVSRRLRLQGASLEAEYEVWLDGEAAPECRFGVELAANLLAGRAPDRWLEANGVRLDPGHLASRGVLHGVERLDLVDAWSGIRVRLACSEPMEVWRTPIETVSTSESGFERVYQGTAFLFLRTLEPRVPWKARLVQSLGDA